MRDVSPEPIFVGVGTSLGDRKGQVASAANALGQMAGLRIVAGSRLYDTAPLGGIAQARFLNGVIELRAGAAWAPESLLDALLGVEDTAGRTRSISWEDRTLDLDLLFWGSRLVRAPRLTLPHPELHRRRFVLAPLCDLAPDLMHPILGWTVRELLARLASEPGACVALPPEDVPEGWPPLPALSPR